MTTGRINQITTRTRNHSRKLESSTLEVGSRLQNSWFRRTALCYLCHRLWQSFPEARRSVLSAVQTHNPRRPTTCARPQHGVILFRRTTTRFSLGTRLANGKPRVQPPTFLHTPSKDAVHFSSLENHSLPPFSGCSNGDSTFPETLPLREILSHPTKLTHIFHTDPFKSFLQCVWNEMQANVREPEIFVLSSFSMYVGKHLIFGLCRWTCIDT